MTGSLSQERVARYRQEGFLCPLDLFDAAEAASLRAELEELERAYPESSLPRPLDQYFRVNAQFVIPLAARIAFDRRVLDVVESILGADLLIWTADFIIKEPNTPKRVSWHQDLTYWGLGATDDEMTAWIALSPATAASGCMRFVPGSHLQPIVPHRDTFAADNMLSRGQEIAVEVNEGAAIVAALQPGQMSLHHGRMFHASGPNSSGDRRIGFAIRYVTPGVRQIVGERDYAILARGVDRERNWSHVAPPQRPFEPAGLALFEQVLRDQTVALATGAEQHLPLYQDKTAAARA